MTAETTKSSKSGAFVAQVIMALVCVIAGWVAAGIWGKATAGAKAMMQMPPATVAVTNAMMRVYNLPERFVAHAEPIQEVDLLPQVNGYVKEIHFKEGDVVKEGQTLYLLDDERYQAVVNQCKADLVAAESEARRATRQFERMQSADERGITQLERDNAESAADKANAAVLQAKANLIVAEYDCKKAKVVAPISGQIGKTSAHIGDYVSPSLGSLAKIVQIDPIRVSFPLTDRSYIAWRQAQLDGSAPDVRLRLVLADGSEYARQGKWDFDDNVMSRETATIQMRLSFPNPDRILIPNSYVTLLRDFRNPPSYPSVPQTALFDLAGGDRGVWVVRADGTAEQRKVDVLEAFEGWVPVTNGLAAGERVVTSGVQKVIAGMKVIEVEGTAPRVVGK